MSQWFSFLFSCLSIVVVVEFQLQQQQQQQQKWKVNILITLSNEQITHTAYIHRERERVDILRCFFVKQRVNEKKEI